MWICALILKTVIIVFYTEGDPKWRLSLVRLDYEMKFENGRLRTAESLTPAKRLSLLKRAVCHGRTRHVYKCAFSDDRAGRMVHACNFEFQAGRLVYSWIGSNKKWRLF